MPDLARDGGGVQRPRAAVGDKREVGGIEPALGCHPAHHMGHLRRRDAQDAFGRLSRVKPKRFRDFFGQRFFRSSQIERHLAAEEPVGAETAQHQIGVGDGRLGAAEAVADRSRRRAGASRADSARRCRPRCGRCCRRRCRPPGCRSSAFAPGVQWHSRRSGRTRSLAHCPRRSRRPWRWCRPYRRLSHWKCRSNRTAPCVPTTPAAGPDSSMRMQDCLASPTSNNPPVDCTMRKLPANPASSRCASISVR